MECHSADGVYRKYGLAKTLFDEYFYRIRRGFDELQGSALPG
jgi:hypothetical protein